MIRQLQNNEFSQAAALSLEVFTRCGKEDFNTEGLDTFSRFIHDEELADALTIYGAFDGNKLIGIMGTKNEGQHLSLFFIRKEYHRKGIGKKLFHFALCDKPAQEMTVHSSSYAVPFYESLGFEKTSDEQETDGLKYTPMKIIRKEKLNSLSRKEAHVMSHPNAKIQLRAATQADILALQHVFETSVRQTCNRHYRKEQIQAWVGRGTPERWKELFESDLCFILAEDTETKTPAGFTSINTEGYLHSLFVHPAYQRQGIGRSLLCAAEEIAYSNRAASIHSEVSRTALPLFEAMGYHTEKEQTVTVGQVEMTNFILRKIIK